MNIKNSNIDSLINNESSTSNISAITTIDTEPSVEVITLDKDGQIDPISFEYNNYRNELNKIYSTTTEEKSILSDFIINNDKCTHILTIRQLNGKRDVLLNKEFDYDNSFKENFLPLMLSDFNNYNKISDINILDSDNNLVIFTARTKENDILNIKYINKEMAIKLNNVIHPVNKVINIKNSKGIGNTFIIVMSILIIGVILIGTIYLAGR